GDGAYRFGLLGSAFDDLFNSPWTSNFSNIMRTDIRDEEKHYALDVEVPGFTKDDIKISLENGYLTIEATKEESKENKDNQGNYLRRERHCGSCSRSFYIGDIKKENISANFKDGILTLTIPKENVEEVAAKKYIEIK
ncbi:MAG TPA: Hsp20/alpha crystallin family protein, partial [Bacilli bacterium]|nr:Hsp20/alpha crystallin family protein [Bacilli bacterium]